LKNFICKIIHKFYKNIIVKNREGIERYQKGGREGRGGKEALVLIAMIAEDEALTDAQCLLCSRPKHKPAHRIPRLRSRGPHPSLLNHVCTSANTLATTYII
jgi:hypothetical protein